MKIIIVGLSILAITLVEATQFKTFSKMQSKMMLTETLVNKLHEFDKKAELIEKGKYII